VAGRLEVLEGVKLREACLSLNVVDTVETLVKTQSRDHLEGSGKD